MLTSRSSTDIQANANTTFVQAEPWAFKEVVQRLTGAGPAASKPPPPPPPPPSTTSSNFDCFKKRPRLQERRRAPAKLELNLQQGPPMPAYKHSHLHHHHHYHHQHHCVLGSPVSTIDSCFVLSSRSPAAAAAASSCYSSSLNLVSSRDDEEERAIAEKGFYLHPSPRNSNNNCEDHQPPKLLPLFPLTSPKDEK